MTQAVKLPSLRGLSLLPIACLLSCVCHVPAQSTSPSPSVTVMRETPPSQQTGAAPDLPKFEVATIKPAKGDDGRSMMMFTPDGISIQGVPMKMLLRESFGVEDDRILGEPGWVKNRFDVVAKVDAEDAPKLKNLQMAQRRAMMLPLLQDRFNLKYHHETRELPTYALVVAKGGLKMKPSAPEEETSKSDSPPKPDDPMAKDKPGKAHSLMMNGRGHLESKGTTTTMLVHILSSQLGRTVQDKTGLTGSYDYTLQWTPDDAGMPMSASSGEAPGKGDPSPDAGGPSLLTALEEQLGLKLEATKSMVDVIVIDHIDLPSEN